jgi:hypothetical protein
MVGDLLEHHDDRVLSYRSMLMILLLFCRSLMVGELDREDVRSSFGLSLAKPTVGNRSLLPKCGNGKIESYSICLITS